MATKRPSPQPDPDVVAIDRLEALIVCGFDELNELHQTPQAEVTAQRAGVMAQAKAVSDQLRAEHRARTGGAR